MSATRSALIWQCGNRTLALGARTHIMGILNATPDSFSDGGLHFDADSAVRRAHQIAAEGADIIDIGGESTRPGSERVSEEEELRRVIPVIEAMAGRTDCLISIDTMKAGVARRAIEAGAHIINDVSALTFDSQMAAVAAEFCSGVVLMHMKGEPRTMQTRPEYEDVVGEVEDYLSARVHALVSAGIDPLTLAVDPGIGFGKALEHNLQLLNALHRLGNGRPVVVGLSRKRFLGDVTGRDVKNRLAGSLAAMSYAIQRGAHIMRVHDVKESCDAARIVDTLLHEQTPHESSETDFTARMDGDH